MRRLACILALASSLACAPAYAANCMDTTEGAAWKASYPDLYQKLVGYFTCIDDPNDPVACNVFVARAAEGVYGVTDFKNADGTYMTANTIMDQVQANPAWSRLGKANDQMVLNNAASGAGDHLIIAVMSDQPHGHVSLVLPGNTLFSSNWKLNVPNSASAFLGNVSKAYVFCRLSWAFSDPSKVELWWRPKGN
jgi:hypothetical protein